MRVTRPRSPEQAARTTTIGSVARSMLKVCVCVCVCVCVASPRSKPGVAPSTSRAPYFASAPSGVDTRREDPGTNCRLVERLGSLSKEFLS
jgi:hypothetical protein